MIKIGKSSRKAQFQISFGIIFSIILIIAFIAVSFYVIKIFLGFRTCGEIGRFYQELQSSIENAKRSPETSQVFSAAMPSSVEYACIADLSKSARGQKSGLYEEISLVNKNLALYPKTKCSGLGGIDLIGIDIANITLNENPFCVKTEKGKISLKIEKALYERLVKVSRA